MTTKPVSIDKKKYAVGLRWINVASENAAEAEILSYPDSEYIISKKPDKSIQMGIFSGDGLDGLPLAAAIASFWAPSKKTILVKRAESLDGQSLIWLCAIAAGKVLAGSDILLETEEQASEIIKKFLSLSPFGVYIDEGINPSIPDGTLINVAPNFDTIAKNNNLKIKQEKSNATARQRQSKSGRNPEKNTTILVAFLFVALVLGGAGYYFKDAFNDKASEEKSELSPAQKKAIIDDLKAKELASLKSLMAYEDFSGIGKYIDQSLVIPKNIVSWSVSQETIDVPGSTLNIEWKMSDGGYMSQLTSVRPEAKVFISDGAQSGGGANDGKSASELVTLRNGAKKTALNHIFLPSKNLLLNFIYEVSQRMDVRITTNAEAPLLTELPPKNSGVIFLNTYSKMDFTLSGEGLPQLLMTAESLSQEKSIKPKKITMAINDGFLSSWTVEASAYLKNKQ